MGAMDYEYAQYMDKAAPFALDLAHKACIIASYRITSHHITSHHK